MNFNIYTLYNTGFLYKDLKKFTNEYIQYRLELFDNICLQSIINQIDKSFIWYIFTNKKIKYFDNFYNKVKRLSFVEIIDISNIEIDKLNEYFLNFSKQFNNLIEFKLDSDDGIPIDFIQIVKQLKYDKSFKVFYPNTYFYDYENKRLFENNQKKFKVPIIYRKYNKLTIFSKFHNQWKIFHNTSKTFYVYTKHKFNHNKKIKFKIIKENLKNKICFKISYLKMKNCKN